MKKTIILQSLIGMFLLINENSFTQTPKEDHCGSHLAMKKYYEQNPKAHKEALYFEKSTQEFIQKKKTKATKEYIVPVVFHVFGTLFNSGTTVNDALIQDALQKLNNDFKGLTTNWNNVDSNFEPLKKALNITFALAELDPDDNPTTGITYHANTSGFGEDSGYDSQIQIICLGQLQVHECIYNA